MGPDHPRAEHQGRLSRAATLRARRLSGRAPQPWDSLPGARRSRAARLGARRRHPGGATLARTLPVPETFPRRFLLGPAPALGALALLGACTRSGAIGPAAIRDQAPEARVTMNLVQAGFIGSGGGGNGVLTYRGQDLPFGVIGLGVGGIGASTVEAEGDVFNLGEVARFPGTYAQARAGAVAADRSFGEMWLQNQAGVIMRLRARRTGLMLALGGDAVRITMR